MDAYDRPPLAEIEARQPGGRFVYLSGISTAIVTYLLHGGPRHISDPQTDEAEAAWDRALSEVLGETVMLVGMILPTIGIVPDFCLALNGQTISATDYPLLADIAPNDWLAGDTITLPDMRADGGATLRGGWGPGEMTGSNAHTITIDELPSHSHTTQPHAHAESGAVPTIINGGIEAPAASASATPTSTGLASVVVDPTGGGSPMPIMPRALTVQWMIVAR